MNGRGGINHVNKMTSMHTPVVFRNKTADVIIFHGSHATFGMAHSGPRTMRGLDSAASYYRRPDQSDYQITRTKVLFSNFVHTPGIITFGTWQN
jgi:hypothetical protein